VWKGKTKDRPTQRIRKYQDDRNLISRQQVRSVTCLMSFMSCPQILLYSSHEEVFSPLEIGQDFLFVLVSITESMLYKFQDNTRIGDALSILLSGIFVLENFRFYVI
jgi:hypothetical protein